MAIKCLVGLILAALAVASVDGQLFSRGQYVACDHGSVCNKPDLTWKFSDSQLRKGCARCCERQFISHVVLFALCKPQGCFCALVTVDDVAGKYEEIHNPPAGTALGNPSLDPDPKDRLQQLKQAVEAGTMTDKQQVDTAPIKDDDDDSPPPEAKVGIAQQPGDGQASAFRRRRPGGHRVQYLPG